jgi:amidase
VTDPVRQPRNVRQGKLLRLLALLAAVLAACTSKTGHDYAEADIESLQAAMRDGGLTSEKLVATYLDEIARIDHAGPQLRAIIEINPDALEQARMLDRERQQNGPRGPLHGIPIVLKANIDTGDAMHTTAGSLALAEHRASDDAFLVAALREAGAVILAKANLSEWANFRSGHSSSGWSSLGGQTRNPYDPRRNPCGSSSGSAVAVAANLTVLAVGTETDGSIVCPAGINGIVGIKPSLGLVSRDGIIPIAHSQDTAGPMSRTVRDAAVLLTAMAAFDPSDPAAAYRPEKGASDGIDYSRALRNDGLAGKRIGILRNHYGAGDIPQVETIVENAIGTLQRAGAEVVDPLELDTSGLSAAENRVLLYEFRADLNSYLMASRAAPRTLADIIRFNDENAATVMPFFGQELMLEADSKGPLTEPDYVTALHDSKRISRNAIDQALHEHRLDAILAPTNGPAWLTDHVNGDSFQLSSSSYAAVSGYPSITVPAGFVRGLPIGVSFIGPAFSEAQLIGIGYAFEQANRARRAPPEL